MIYASSSANKCKYIHVQSIIIIIVTWTSLNSVMIETCFSTKNTKSKRFFLPSSQNRDFDLKRGHQTTKGTVVSFANLNHVLMDRGTMMMFWSESCISFHQNDKCLIRNMANSLPGLFPTSTIRRPTNIFRNSQTALLSCVNKNDTDLARTMTQLPQEQKTVLYWSKKM